MMTLFLSIEYLASWISDSLSEASSAKLIFFQPSFEADTFEVGSGLVTTSSIDWSLAFGILITLLDLAMHMAMDRVSLLNI